MKRLISLLTCVMACVAMFGATLTATFDFKTLKGLEIDGTHYDVSYKTDGSVQANEHWQPLNSITADGVVLTFGRKGSTDPAIYRTNPSATGTYELRMYGSDATKYTQMTVTAPAGKVITAMSSVNTSGTQDTAGVYYTSSVGTLNASKPTAVTWSCPEGASEVTITYQKNLRYTSLTVTLEDEEAVEPEPEPDPKYKVSLAVMEYVDGNLVPNPEAGTLTLSGTKTEFEEGEYYYVSASASDGYCFRFILDGDGSTSKNTAISRRMGDHDVTVTAVFDRLHAVKTSVWEDKKGVLTEDTSEYSSLGYINLSTDKYVSNRKGYVADEVVNISAYAYSAYEFRYLLVNGEKIEDNTASVTVGNRDLDIRAVFKKIPVGYTLDVSYDKDKGSVVLSPEPEDGVYEEGTEVTVTAIPGEDYVFSHYETTDYLNTRKMANEYTSNPLTIVMDGNYYLSAVFKEPEYGVTTSVRSLDAEGNELAYALGSVSTSPSGYYYDNRYHKGDKVTFTASLNYYYDESAEFKYFLVDGEQHAENPFVYTVGDHNAEVVAVFQLKHKVYITSDAYRIGDDGSLVDDVYAKVTISPDRLFAYVGDVISASTEPLNSLLEFDYFLAGGEKYFENPAEITVSGEDFDIKAIYKYKKIVGNFNVKTWYYRDDKNCRQDDSVGTYEITPENEFFRYFDKVTVKGVPAENYELDHITFDDHSYSTKTVSDSDEITFSFTNNYGNDYDLNIYFIPKVVSLDLNVLTLNEDGSVKEDAVGGGIWTYPEKPEYRWGDNVQFSYWHASGYRFSHFIVNGERYDEYPIKFILGPEPLEITAVFVEFSFPLKVYTNYKDSGNDAVGKVVIEPQKDLYKVGDKMSINVEAEYGYVFDYMYINKVRYNSWEFPLEYTVNDKDYRDDIEIIAYFQDAPEIYKMVFCREMDGDMQFELDLDKACRIVFDDGKSRQELPIPGQGDQYATYLQGTMVNVEIIPNEGYEYLFTRGVEGETTSELKFTTRWGYDFGECFEVMFCTKESARTYTHSTGVSVADYWGPSVVPGSITSSRVVGEQLKPGDELTFSAKAEEGFRFSRFNVNIYYRGQYLSSYSSSENPMTLTVGEKDNEISVIAAFEIDMPKIFIGDSNHRITFGENDYGWIEVSPEPALMAYDDCAYFPKGTEVTLTVVLREGMEAYYYLHEMDVDGQKTYMNPIRLTMDQDHFITPNLRELSYDYHAFYYTQYHQERGVIDFYEKIWNDFTPLDCFVDNIYVGSIEARDSININTHPAFKPGKVHFVRFRDASYYINNALYVMTAPKVSYKPYVVNLGGVGSGQIDIYEIVIEADPAARIEYEVYDVKNYTTRWYSPEEYKALFALLGVDRVAVLPEVLGYRLTGIRAVADHPAEWGRTLESSTVSVPTYDYIRTGLTELTADELLGAEVYDLNGRRIHSTDSLAPGIYILRRGSAVRKVLVR